MFVGPNFIVCICRMDHAQLPTDHASQTTLGPLGLASSARPEITATKGKQSQARRHEMGV